jgi:hypothetical protein
VKNSAQLPYPTNVSAIMLVMAYTPSRRRCLKAYPCGFQFLFSSSYSSVLSIYTASICSETCIGLETTNSHHETKAPPGGGGFLAAHAYVLPRNLGPRDMHVRACVRKGILNFLQSSPHLLSIVMTGHILIGSTR